MMHMAMLPPAIGLPMCLANQLITYNTGVSIAILVASVVASGTIFLRTGRWLQRQEQQHAENVRDHRAIRQELKEVREDQERCKRRET